jgi:hypothetical protein
VLLLEKEWQIPASTTSCVKDRATLWNQAQGPLYELLVSRIIVQAPFLSVERSPTSIILLFAITSHLS